MFAIFREDSLRIILNPPCFSLSFFTTHILQIPLKECSLVLIGKGEEQALG